MAAWTIVACLLASSPLAAQAPCEPATANTAFSEGRFDDALAALLGCDEADEGVRLSALQLRAKAYLALDEVEAATGAVRGLLALRPNFQTNPLTDSERFRRLLAETRANPRFQQVSSVSKTPEDLREAPATVMVVTSEEIRRRGYLDLEAVLHDLPGFDISRGDGFLYAGIYQRGYRSVETNRTLFLIDGVEENDVFGNTVWLSRQYALSNIERVEVVYGPATTIYGANAFQGVINVITKDPESTFGDRALGHDVQLTMGTGETVAVDATFGGRIPEQPITWSITGRLFRSRGRDLSDFPDWDYDPSVYDGVDYGALLSLEDPESVGAFLTAMNDPDDGFADCTFDPDCPFRIVRAPDDSVERIIATPEGEGIARERDGRGLSQLVNGEPLRFSNPTDDWYVAAKLNFTDLALGFQSWRRNESTSPWRPDQITPGGDNGARWVPESTSMYARFERALGERLTFTFFSRFKVHRLNGISSTFSFETYARSRLDITDLARGVDPTWRQTFNTRSNTQLRNELTLSWVPRANLSVVSGIETRNSSVGATTISSSEPNPSETGSPGAGVLGGNQISSRDLGLYAQASLEARPNLKFVVGGRVDDNRIRDSGGYKTVFNPRLAMIGTPGSLFLKAIYAQAFQDPPNFQRYQTFGSRERANPGLGPEQVRNFELSVGWEIADSAFVELAAYWAGFSDIVQEVPDAGCGLECATANPTRFENVGARRIRGVQVSGTWRYADVALFGNYTFTDPLQKVADLRVRDIASHQLNLGLSSTFGDDWSGTLRGNLVGGKQTGAGTTAGIAEARSVDAYTVFHGSLNRRLGDVELQLALTNIFDAEYVHAGVRTADGVNFVTVHPQLRRTMHVRASYRR